MYLFTVLLALLLGIFCRLSNLIKDMHGFHLLRELCLCFITLFGQIKLFLLQRTSICLHSA
ncbi:hypothetical protein C4K37_3852 [Pseudomonas chlororaphis subsp. piscium]|nr:hypothetical protein C4K37_3852 [Pseudomonas chlororaphis subsp. piscium]AZC44786.1 hypothetical protein C4K36_3863 [Pseudomonas chlororaphis subsp. piscium]